MKASECLAGPYQAVYQAKPHTSLADEATYLCDTVKPGPQPNAAFSQPELKLWSFKVLGPPNVPLFGVV